MTFVFVNAKNRFSHDAAHFMFNFKMVGMSTGNFIYLIVFFDIWVGRHLTFIFNVSMRHIP